MRLLIKSRKITLREKEKSYIREKMNKMGRYLPRFAKLEIEVNDIRGGEKGGLDKGVEATTTLRGKQIRVEETSDTVNGAVDLLEDSLERVLRKRKEKRIDQSRRTKGWLKRLLPGEWLKRK